MLELLPLLMRFSRDPAKRAQQLEADREYAERVRAHAADVADKRAARQALRKKGVARKRRNGSKGE